MWDSLHKAQLSTGVTSSMHLLCSCAERGARTCQVSEAVLGLQWIVAPRSPWKQIQSRDFGVHRYHVHWGGPCSALFLTGLFGWPVEKIMAQTALVTCSSRTAVPFPSLTGRLSRLCSQHCKSTQRGIVTSKQKPDHAIEVGTTTVRASLLLRAAGVGGFRAFWDFFLLEGEG